MNDEWNPDDFDASDYEHFDFKEKWDKKTGDLISVEVKPHDITHGLLESLFSKTNDDHEYRDRANKAGEMVEDEVEFSDQFASAEQLFGQAQEHEPVDVEWWDRLANGKQTDPEDEPDEQDRNERVHRIADSSLDPTGNAIYCTKELRRQQSQAKTYRNKRLDHYSTRSKPRKQSDADVERYLAAKLKKAGKPTPDTVEGWDALIARHKAEAAARRINADFRGFIGWRFNCKRAKAYQIIKEIENGQGPWTQEVFRELIDEFNRLRNGSATRPWDKPKSERGVRQVDDGVFEGLRFDPPVSFRDW